MASSTVVVSRSDKFPVGTVVQAFLPASSRHLEGRPSGTATAEATVDATGKLTFTNLPEGVYALYGEVAGKPANLQLGNVAYVAPGTLKARIAERRVLVVVLGAS